MLIEQISHELQGHKGFAGDSVFLATLFYLQLIYYLILARQQFSNTRKIHDKLQISMQYSFTKSCF